MATFGERQYAKRSGEAIQTSAYAREREDPLPEDWFSEHDYKLCRIHSWRELVEGCFYCARFHDERVEEVQIDGKRSRRFTPVADVEKAVAAAAKKDSRPRTRYGRNSLNTQMSNGCAPSAEDEYLESIEINKEEVSDLASSVDPEYRVYLDLYAEGVTTRGMAEKLGVSQSTAARKRNKAIHALRVAANGGEHDWAPLLLAIRHFGARQGQQL